MAGGEIAVAEDQDIDLLHTATHTRFMSANACPPRQNGEI